MKQLILRTLSVLLAITFVVSCFACFSITTSAANYVTGANGVSASYKAGKYYQHYQNVTITGDNVTDVLAMAISQLGYQEGDSDGSYAGTSGGSSNFTEYNYNMGKISGSYGGSSYAWCASFVSWCLLQGGATTQNTQGAWCRSHKGDINYIWREVSCAQWFTQLETVGYGKKRGTYTPESGDLIFFWNGSRISHIGLVLYCDGSKVYTIEGNTSSASGLESNGGGVYFKNYALTSTYIHGYGDMPYKSNSSVTKIDYSGKNPTTGLYMSTTNKYLYSSESQAYEGNGSYAKLLPKFTMFNVTKVCSNGSLQISYEGGTYYVLNNGDRVIQLSNSSNSGVGGSGGGSGSSSATLVNSSLDAHTLNGKDMSSIASVTAGETVGVRGWSGYSVAISKYGYYFDGNFATTTWTTNPGAETEAAVTAAGGSHAKRYHIQADTSSLSSGVHSISYVLLLSDGSIQTVDTINIRVVVSSTGPVTPPSTDSGNTQHTCSFGEWSETKPASCTEKGTRTRQCTCGKSETEDIPVIDHVEGDWITDTEAQVGAEGSKHTECTACGKTIQTETIPALPLESTEEDTASEDATDASEDVTADATVDTQETSAEVEETAAEESQEDAAEESEADNESSSALKGCNASVSALGVILMLPAALLLAKKKRED